MYWIINYKNFKLSTHTFREGPYILLLKFLSVTLGNIIKCGMK